MSVAAVVTILKGSAAGAKHEGKEVHSIPVKTPYTGPANVDAYFVREKHESGEGENRSVSERAALRGRGLQGMSVRLPEGFEAAVLVEKSGGRFEVERTLESIMFWEHDKEPSERSSLPRALAFLPVASALAAPQK